MSAVAKKFVRAVITRQLITSVVGFLVIALLSPNLIVLDPPTLNSLLGLVVVLAALTLVGTVVGTLLLLRAHRGVLRSLSGGSEQVRRREIGAFAELPSAITLRFFGINVVIGVIGVIPGIRPERLDLGRAVSLLILAITILGACAILQYVLVRAATLRVLELGSIEPITSLLEALERRKLPRRRLIQKFFVASVAPVALVGVGAVLITHAHLRTLTEQSRKNTALLLARIALDPGPVQGSADARKEAVAAAAQYGFIASITGPRLEGEPTLTREGDGSVVLGVPLEEGQASVRFSGDLDLAVTTEGAAIALVAVLIAALLGILIGRALAADLTLATHRVRLLGTDIVLRGATQIARPARFRLVAKLGRAIEVLAERFRIFAAAQERALDAQEAAQRMRGLLFASVSHDLKSPLNAILGFAELVGREELTVSQQESLALISTRGRELLALIESILDTARVEAGQLTLIPRPMQVATFVTESTRKARDLAGDPDLDVVVEVAEELPNVPLDPAYAARALAIIIAHAMRLAAAEPASGGVLVRAVRPASPRDQVRIDIELSARNTTPAELEALFAKRASSRGRGLTLGLSLARSIMELHGGAVTVEGAPDGTTIVQCWLPLSIPGKRPRLSSKPTLG
jgi:signal transduction histidine kinase